jgi:hypothetical protein
VKPVSSLLIDDIITLIVSTAYNVLLDHSVIRNSLDLAIGFRRRSVVLCMIKRDVGHRIT